MTTYPQSPGYKAEGPSREAAEAETSQAATLRSRVALVLLPRPMTADECADLLQESVLAIRPRFSELKRLGLIQDTGLRRMNASGHRATVWRLNSKQLTLI